MQRRAGGLQTFALCFRSFSVFLRLPFPISAAVVLSTLWLHFGDGLRRCFFCSFSLVPSMRPSAVVVFHWRTLCFALSCASLLFFVLFPFLRFLLYFSRPPAFIGARSFSLRVSFLLFQQPVFFGPRGLSDLGPSRCFPGVLPFLLPLRSPRCCLSVEPFGVSQFSCLPPVFVCQQYLHKCTPFFGAIYRSVDPSSPSFFSILL